MDKDQLARRQRRIRFRVDPTLFMLTAQRKKVSRRRRSRSRLRRVGESRARRRTDEEIEKARNILLANFYRRSERQRARQPDRHLRSLLRRLPQLFNAADDYRKVTKEDVRRARKNISSRRTAPWRRSCREKAGPESGAQRRKAVAVGSGQCSKKREESDWSLRSSVRVFRCVATRMTLAVRFNARERCSPAPVASATFEPLSRR